MLTVKRVKEFRDRIRKYKVMVDEKEVGQLGVGESIDVDITPGSHEVYVEIDWCRSKKLTIDYTEGETVILECGNSMGGFKILFSLVYVTALKDKYLWIKEVEK